MVIEFVLLADWMTKEAKKYTKQLCDCLAECVQEVTNEAGAQVLVCKCEEGKAELFDYLCSIDAIQGCERGVMDDLCPEALVIADAM